MDGIVAVSVVDLLRNSGCFTREEAQEYIDIGVLNGLFVLGRTIGFIGQSINDIFVLIVSKFEIFLKLQVIIWIRSDSNKAYTVTRGMTSHMCYRSLK